MKRKQLLTKTLLVAAMLFVWMSAWATTETFGSSKSSTKDNAITGTAVNIAGTSNPGGTGSDAVFGLSGEKGLKLRTNTALTFNVNFGYRIKNITIKAYQNNKSSDNHDMTCSGFSVDGTTYNFDTAKEIPYNMESTSTVPVVISTGRISATSSVAFNFTNTSVAQNQIFAYVTVEYEAANYSEDYESTTVETLQSTWTRNTYNNGTEAWPGTYAPNFELKNNSCGNSSTWFLTYSGGSRQRTAYYYFASAYAGKAYKFDAKLNMNKSNNGDESRLYFMNGSKAGNSDTPSNFLFYIGVNADGKAYISNGTDSDVSTIGGLTNGTENISTQLWTKNYGATGWFNASCIIDLEKGTASVTVKSGSTTENLSVNLKSGTKQLSGISVLDGRASYGTVAMDDIALYELTYPAFTLTETEKEFYVEDDATVSVTDITGDISVESDNADVATVSYSDGTITINGVAAGTTTVKVTGKNDGLTITKTIDVTINGFAAKYTAAKTAYDTKVESLDADGQAYWTANVTDPATVTTSEAYATAVAALPTTYIAAVKAQTTKGSDMTDAMPTGNAGWTCEQGNGPASYLTTGATETYSNGTNNAKFAAGNIMSQTISGLPNGYYKVQFYGVVNAANSVSTVSGSDLVEAYANSTNLDIDVVLQNSCTPTDYLRTIEAQVTDGTLTYGLRAKTGVEDAGNWAVAKIYKLTYLGADKNSYTINAVAGETIIKELATGSVWASEDYDTYIPKVILYNSKYYVLDDSENANLDRYYASYVMGATNETKQINYTLDESIKAFFEGESMSYVGHSFFGTLSNRSDASNGRAVTVYTSSNSGGAKTSSTISKDLYNISVAFVYWDDKTDRFKLQYSTDNEKWVDIATFDLAKNTNSVESANVLIPSASYLRLMNDVEQTPRHSIDYILVKKLNVNDDPVVVGDINNTTEYLAAMTDKVTLKPGESYHYQFVNHNTGSGDATNNWILPVYPAGSEDATIALHANKYEDRGDTVEGCSLTSNGSDDPWADFQNQMNGATVDMDVEYTTNKILNVNCDITTSGGYSWTYTYTSDYTGSTRTFTGDVDLALSVSSSWLEVLEKAYIGTATMKCNAGKYGTFAAPFDVTIPDGVTTYTASLNNAKTAISLEERTETTIPAGTPVIIYSENGLAETPLSGVIITEEATCQSGILYGALQSDQTIPSGSFVLQTQDGVQQFYKLNSEGLKSNVNRCWIQLPAEPTVAKASLAISPDDITGVKSVSANAKNAPMKRIVNGQLVIEKDGKQYNAMGQEK